METLRSLTERQVQRHLGVSDEEFEYLKHPNPAQMNDPFGYKGMPEFITHLRTFQKKQEKNKQLALVVRSDYDTDGVLAGAILAASLSMFGIGFYVYIPSMEDGYGFCPEDVDKMKQQLGPFNMDIGMILTADNGIRSFSGVSYAKSLGIDVLITDHHPAPERLPAAKAAIDPYIDGDLYPFKGNSGACVAWKCMLAYASTFAKDALPAIERLCVFAGIANVADVMPLRGENRYIVKAAVECVKQIMAKGTYEGISNTGVRGYDTVFHALFQLIGAIQETKDAKRAKEGKTPIPLPMNEELFGYYLGPVLNAPRRVHDTCLEAQMLFLTPGMDDRAAIIANLLALNEEKSRLRDDVLHALPPGVAIPVLIANTKKGISGLIAGELAAKSSLPSIVFSRHDPKMESPIYIEPPADGMLSGSARSNPAVPLDRLMAAMNARCPGILKGGGHASAAGFTIQAKDYRKFQELLAQAILQVSEEALREGIAQETPENRLTLVIGADALKAFCPRVADGREQAEEHLVDTKRLAQDVKETIAFLESLRPFGEAFQAETSFRLIFDKAVCHHDWNPDFWKTFKFNLFGVEVLTFDKAYADRVKKTLDAGGIVSGIGKLKLNEFRGRVTPQVILSAE